MPAKNRNVSFKNSQGQRLVGVLSLPKSSRGPMPAVIVLHGFSDSHDYSLIRQIADKLVRNGFIVLRFSFSGHLPSGGTHKEVTPSQAVKDIGSAVDFLKKIPQVSQRRIGLVGHSLGGFAALMYAGLNQGKIGCIATLASFYETKPVFDYFAQNRRIDQSNKDYISVNGFKVTPKFLTDKLYAQKQRLVTDIHCPTLIIQGDQDETVPVKTARQIYKLLDIGGMKIIRGTGHNFKNPIKRRQAINSLVDWFKTNQGNNIIRAAIAILRCRDKIILIKRSTKVGAYKNLYANVGGYIPKGVKALAVARQEIQEELGLKAGKIALEKIGKSYVYSDKKTDVVLHAHPFLFRTDSKANVRLNWENSKYVWVSPEEALRVRQIVPHLKKDLQSVGLLKK